jgi:hypothetical protein
MEKQIKVLAARTQDELETKGADVEDVHFETVAEAKKRAKYLLTEAFRHTSESSDRLGYSQMLVNGERANAWLITSEATHEPH